MYKSKVLGMVSDETALLVDGQFFSMFSHYPFLCACAGRDISSIYSSSYEVTSTIRLEGIYASFNFNYLPKGPISKYSYKED